jgi:hypothetical protein
MMKKIFYIFFVCAFAASVHAQNPLPIQGKGMYLWQLWTANSGGKNLGTVISKLKSIGATWLVIKMGDGDSYYNSSGKSLYTWATTNYGSMDSVVSLFHSNGIRLLAFQYVYGVPHHWGNVQSETDVANWILDVKGIDGLLIDAEIEYDTLQNRVAAAQAYCDSIHAHHPLGFLGLTAWARINGHSTFPWTTFLDRVDVNMPQTYWAARPITPSNELNLMSSQFTYNTNTWVSQGDSAAAKPIMPIGQGEYFGYGSDVQQGDVASFSNLCDTTYYYPGISLWEYNQITHSYVWDEYTAGWHSILVAPFLLNPTMDSTPMPDSIDFSWNSVSGAETYELQISYDNAFKNIYFGSFPSADTSLNFGSLVEDTTYYWRVRANNTNDHSNWSATWRFRTARITSVEQNNAVVKQFELSQNYPNPFNPTTRIHYSVVGNQNVTLKVYDVLGREVATLVNERKAPGTYDVSFNAGALPSGVYFYRLKAGSFTSTKKLMLLK